MPQGMECAENVGWFVFPFNSWDFGVPKAGSHGQCTRERRGNGNVVNIFRIF